MSTLLRDRALRGECLADVLIIDWHVHLGRWALSYLPEDGEQVFAAMDRVGVAKICVNGITCPDTAEGNNRVAEFARRFPARVVPVAALNPYQHDMVAELERCTAGLGMRAVKIHSMVQGAHSPDLRRSAFDWEAVWRFCAERGLPILAHGIVSDDDIRRHPETIFVIAHGIGAPERLVRLRECPNVYVDTAWTQTKDWSLRAVVDALGADRVLWGTDAPLDDFAQRLGAVLDAGLPEADQRAILGLNAARLLGLPA